MPCAAIWRYEPARYAVVARTSAHGCRRDTVGTRRDGGAGVQVNDRKGRTRLLIGIDGEKAAGLRVLDEGKAGRIEAITRDERAAVVHRGPDEARRAATVTASEGKVVSRVSAAGGSPRVEMGVTAKGNAGVTVMDGGGTSRLSLTVSPTGMAFLGGADPSGERRFVAGTWADRTVVVDWPRNGLAGPGK